MARNGETTLTGKTGGPIMRSARPPTVHIKRPGERRSLSRSATRALDLLEYFGEMRRPLRAIEIARMLGLSPSSADQLLKTMVDSAHLVFDAGAKTYLPSLRLIGISRWIIESYGADEGLRDLVRNIQRRTGMAVTLCVPNDLFMQIVDLVTPREMPGERGLRISVFGSAIGSAYLSTLGADAFTRLAQRARVPKADLPGLRATAQRVRELGFADGETAGDIWSIAIPLREQNMRVPMVLGLAGAADQVLAQRGQLTLLMREAVQEWGAKQPPAGR